MEVNNKKSRNNNNKAVTKSTTVYDHDDHDQIGSNISDDHDHDQEEEMMMNMMELRRGPWTVEEDLTLMNYIAVHGEGRWNSLARCAGLKRTGKSCRLRWLNYLRPDVRRGNITLEEQLLILELHSRWGNRWSKIAQYLPGRTDNEIKNYWRTRVQKHAKQLKCDVNSKQFKDTMRYLWMPRLVERIQAASTANGTPAAPSTGSTTTTTTVGSTVACSDFNPSTILGATGHFPHAPPFHSNFTPENSANSSDSLGTQVSDLTDYYSLSGNNNPSANHDYLQVDQVNYNSPNCGGHYFQNQGMMDYQAPNTEQNAQQHWSISSGDTSDIWWNVEDIYFLQQQLNNNSL